MVGMVLGKVMRTLDQVATAGALNKREEARVDEIEILEGRIFLGGGLSGMKHGWEEVGNSVRSSAGV